MGWPNNYEQTEYPASYFGIRPGGSVDNTIGFQTLAAFYTAKTDNYMVKIKFPAGIYLTDNIEFTTPNFAYNKVGYNWEGAGINETIIKPNTNALSSSVFMTFGCTLSSAKFDGIGFVGNASNTLQDGLHFIPDNRDSATDGGLSYGEFNNLQVYQFTGRQMCFRGGENGLYPMQFINFNNVTMSRATGNHFPCLEMMGQIGQIYFANCDISGLSKTNNGGANAYIGADYRYQRLYPSAYDTTNHFITNTNTGFLTVASNLYPSIAPVRFIGTSLPTTSPQVALGTTYFMQKYNMVGATALDTTFSLHTTRANAASATKITCSSQGTPANYSLVGIWATDLTANEFTTEEPHRLVLGDNMQFVGSNLPTGASLATDYYIIRTAYNKFKLASSQANAIAGTAISMSGGTLTDFGFVKCGGNQSNMRRAYSVRADVLTLQSAELGIFLSHVQDAVFNVHAEALKRVFEVVGNGSMTTILGGNFSNNTGNGGGDAGLGFFSNGASARTNVIGAIGMLTVDTPTSYFNVLPSTSGGGTNKLNVTPESFYQGVSYAASITPPSVACILEVGQLTGNITINAPSLIPPKASIMEFSFVSDGSARTPTWNAAYKGTPTATASAANQHLIVRFRSNGTSLMKVYDTGWYTP